MIHASIPSSSDSKVGLRSSLAQGKVDPEKNTTAQSASESRSGATHGSNSADKVTLSSRAVAEASADKAHTAAAPNAVDAAIEIDKTTQTNNTNNPGNRYADTILSLIGGQLTIDIADGAEQAALQSRFEAGLGGFLQGFGEAYAQLDGLPAFDSETRNEILDTKEDVLDGLAALAEKLGLDASLIDSARKQLSAERVDAESKSVQPVATFDRFNMLSAQQNSFAFELTTADGDKVTILASTLEAIQATKDKQQERLEFGQKNTFAFEVEGSLDADELEAINELLNSAAKVSESFFDGNVQDAFMQALEMGFDSEQITSFSLSLTQTTTTRLSAYETQNTHSNSGLPSKNLVGVGSFLGELNLGRSIIEQLSLQQEDFSVLLDAVAQLQSGHKEVEKISQFIDENNL